MINYKATLYGININAIVYNYATIENGYIYGNNIYLNGYLDNSRNTPFVTFNYSNIKNIYSLVGIDADEINEYDNTGLIVIDMTLEAM